MSIDVKGRSENRPRQQTPQPSRAIGRRLLDYWVHLFLVGWALLVSVPLLWVLVTSFKTSREIFNNPWELPGSWNIDNFVRAWNSASIGQYFINSAIVVASSVILTLMLAALTAYVIEFYTFPGSRAVYYFFIVGLMFPVFLALVPLFFVVQGLGLLNSYAGLILVYTAYSMPFSVLFLAAFFRSLPRAMAEAALLDGCSHWGAFFRVMLPLARPGLVSIGIFNFIHMWNQYLLPLVLNTEESRYVLTQGLAVLAVNQGYRADYGALFAGLTIAIVPVLVIYVVFQRRVQEGLTAGALR